MPAWHRGPIDCRGSFHRTGHHRCRVPFPLAPRRVTIGQQLSCSRNFQRTWCENAGSELVAATILLCFAAVGSASFGCCSRAKPRISPPSSVTGCQSRCREDAFSVLFLARRAQFEQTSLRGIDEGGNSHRRRSDISAASGRRQHLVLVVSLLLLQIAPLATIARGRARKLLLLLGVRLPTLRDATRKSSGPLRTAMCGLFRRD